MSDAFLIARARVVADRLAQSRCWHQGPKPWSRGVSTKWWDLRVGDVEEAIIRLRELASAIGARSDETRSGSAVGKSAASEAGDAR